MQSQFFLVRIPFLMVAIGCGAVYSQTLSLYSGNGQVVQAQHLTAVPFVVQATDATGKPLPGAPVTWTIPTGSGSLRGPQPGTVPETTTDANGLARAGFLASSVFGSSFEANVVEATSGSSRVDFFVTTFAGLIAPYVQLVSPSIDNRVISGPAGSMVPGGIVVNVIAQSGADTGKPVPNVGVRILPPTDPSVPSASCNAPGGIVLTDAKGTATCDVLLGPQTGTSVLQAEVGEFQNTASFTLQVSAGQSCTFSLSPGSQSLAAAGGSGTINVTVAGSCGWTAASNANWITITSGTSGTGSGTVAYTVAANTGAARTGTLTIAGQSFSVTQAAAAGAPPASLTITTTSLQNATANAPYNFTLSANGGKPPYTWTANGLPSWLSLSPSGTLSGMAPASGSFQFSVTVVDSAGVRQSQALSVSVVTSTGGLTILNTGFPNGAVNQQYQQNLNTSGGCVTPFTPLPRFQLGSGTLPPGLTVQDVGGGYAITGTPTTAGSFNFTLTVADACGATASASFSITISGGSVPTITLTGTPSSLTFYVQAGSTATPPAQSLTLATSAQSLNFTATSSAPWLSLSSASGAAPALLTASIINFAQMSPNTYNANITISSSASNSPLVIPVTLTVGTAATLTVAPEALTVALQSGASTAQGITVSSTGNSLHFTAASDSPWLVLNPASGDTPGTVAVTVNAANMAAGTYNGTITITSAAATKTVAVSLRVSGPPPAPAPVITEVDNAATLLPGPVSPGELVAIKGTGLGPATPAGAALNADGSVGTAAAGTRVWFDSLPAPILYASAGQINAIVPFGVAGRNTVALQVEYNGVKSTAINPNVVDTTPGIFMLDASRQGAIVNQDYTVNSAQNPADPESVVSIYGTGAGLLLPLPSDGKVIGTDILPQPVLPVHVTIGGQDAFLWYQGAAPYDPAGVVQVNAQIPAGIHGSVTVTMTAGSQVSPGVILWVK